MQRTRFAVAVLVAGLAACAAPPATRPASHGPPGLTPPIAQAPEDRTICEDVRPTGSNIAHTECRTESDAQNEAEAGQAWMERQPATPPYHESDDPFKR